MGKITRVMPPDKWDSRPSWRSRRGKESVQRNFKPQSSRHALVILDVLITLNCRVALQGEYSEAKLLYHKALKIAEDTLGEKNPNTANFAYNLAGLFMKQARSNFSLGLDS